MTILFLHGWESTPGGKKPQYFQARGHTVLNPALSPDSFEQALRAAQESFDQGHPEIVIGSSRGGAVGMNISIGDTPLLLLCPAWKAWGKACSVKAGTVIAHSRQDEIVAFEDSLELVAKSPSGVRLIELGKDHRMADEATLEAILDLALDLTGTLKRKE